MLNLFAGIKQRWVYEKQRLLQIRADKKESTYLFFDSLLNVPPMEMLPLRKEDIAHLQEDAENILAHKFDLLGSGDVHIEYGMKCKGFNKNKYDYNILYNIINKSNKEYSSSILKNIRGEYELLDWQLDFKSGYRWREDKHSLQNKRVNAEGADIKVPWELARLEHLPRLALLYSHSLDPLLPIEFQNQVTDFVGNNPPRYGVNWLCTMDVAIRISNILLAYWIFKNAGYQNFTEEFETIMTETAYSHGVHITKNLEYQTQHLNNHYFANVCGLFFVSLALPSTPQIDSWLAYSIQEFKKELLREFDEDGANFEASTAYHCLSTELAVYTAALLLGNKPEVDHRLKNAQSDLFRQAAGLKGIPTPALPTEIVERFYGMRNFIESIIKQDGTIHQIGDNDSGHFFTPSPELIQAPLNRLLLADAVRSLWTNKTTGLEATLVKMLRGSGLLPVMKVPTPHGFIGDEETFTQLKKRIEEQPDYQKFTWRYPLKNCGTAHQFGYQGFGLYGWKTGSFYCAVRCGNVGQDGHGGHAHSDQLAVELMVEDTHIFTDVGSYIYTPAPETRNQYRATPAHSGPKVRGIKEPANLTSNIFHFPDTFKAECLYWGKLGFIGTHIGYGEKIYRLIELTKNELIITDAVFKDTVRPINFVPNPPPFSRGYGQSMVA